MVYLMIIVYDFALLSIIQRFFEKWLNMYELKVMYTTIK